MISELLHDGWTLRPAATPDAAGGRIPKHLAEPLAQGVATQMPATVHAILLRAGLIEDPRDGANEAGARWVGWTAWELTRDVEVPEGLVHAALEFDGIDTVAELTWDGQPLGATRNMHRRYRFEVPATAGTHRLAIGFAAPEVEALAAQERLGGPRPNPYDRPFEAIRKVASNFGWDWGPDFPSAGLWREVRFTAWDEGRLDDVGVSTVPLSGDRWRVLTTVTTHTDTPAVLTVRVAGQVATARIASGRQDTTLELVLDSPQLWWPHTHGTPHLYDHDIELTTLDGRLVDSRRLRTGVRQIELDTTDGGFTFIVNGQPVVIRGLNWIPDHCFPGEATPGGLRARFTDAVEAHTNMLRVWGGGSFESEEFYDLADELGVMVWQDFPFACAGYSEAPELADEVAAEAQQNILRLRRRASLALWCGCNENLWAQESWEWPAERLGRDWGAAYYFELLPGLVSELDPHRPYVPGSPFSPTPGVLANDSNEGCQHLWDVWNDADHERYLDHTPRFVSEFGYQGPPAWSTMLACVGQEHMQINDEAMLVHQKAEDGHVKVERGLANHGGTSRDIDVWWWRAQHLQALAARVGICHLRSLHPVCSGTIWWQLNDCWPVISWSVVDSAGQRKPAWYALRHSSADRALALLGHGNPQLRVINDHRAAWQAEVTVEACDVDTGEVHTVQIPVDVPTRAAHQSPVDLFDLAAPRRVLRARAGDVVSAVWFPRALAGNVPAPRFDVAAQRTDEGWQLTVTAETLLVDVAFMVDRLDPAATIDDQLVTLWPGQTHTFRVTGARAADPAEFGSEEVCWYWGR